MRKYIGPLVLLILGFACHAAFVIIGSKVEPDGRLIEAFSFLPVGFLSIALSIVISLVILLFSTKIKPFIGKNLLGVGIILVSILYFSAAIFF